MNKWGVCCWCGKLVPADKPTPCGTGKYQRAKPNHIIISCSVEDETHWHEHGYREVGDAMVKRGAVA